MENVLQRNLIQAAQQLEQQLDNQLGQLDNLDADDIRAIRERRIKELKEQSKQKQEWLTNVVFFMFIKKFYCNIFNFTS